MDGLTPAPERGAIAPGMPAPAPADMPTQRLDVFAGVERRAFLNASACSRARPRWVALGLTALLTAIGAVEMAMTLSLGAVTPLTVLVLLLFVVNFAWIALAFVNAAIGTAVILFGRRPPATATPLAGRTAMLMPTYNERPERTFAAIEAMARGIHALGETRAFDWFVLSDTTDAEVALTEQSAFTALRARLSPIGARVYYRRRRRNIHRKAGNIADFCKRWGGAYDHLLILDADSLMEAETIVTLARRMEADPDAGIIQTVPRLIHGRTALARLQQFANRVYGPVLAAGLAWWTQSEGNYWGHNAIIRRRAFTAAAGLPTLSGAPPFGGHILSHDFVEAALIRRAGYSVTIAYDLGGSYEECPASLIDLSARDRRWCQGNLQHARVLAARGLHWVSRFHLVNGIASYLASLLWLVMIVAGLALTLQVQFVRPEYFADTGLGLPVLPAVDPTRALGVLALAAVVLFGPKLLGALVFALDREARRMTGGLRRLLASLVVEIVISALIAPVTMLIQSRMIVSIVSGKDAGWKPQRRDDGGVPLADLVRFHAWHVGCGLVIATLAWLVSPAALAWLLPAVTGMILALPVSALTGAQGAGAALRRAGLLRTPQETLRPPIAHTALAVRRPNRLAVDATPDLPHVIADAGRRSAHLALIDKPEERRRGDVDPVEATAFVKISQARTLQEALSYLGPEERAVTLASADLVERLGRLPMTDRAA